MCGSLGYSAFDAWEVDDEDNELVDEANEMLDQLAEVKQADLEKDAAALRELLGRVRA